MVQQVHLKFNFSQSPVNRIFPNDLLDLQKPRVTVTRAGWMDDWVENRECRGPRSGRALDKPPEPPCHPAPVPLKFPRSRLCELSFSSPASPCFLPLPFEARTGRTGAALRSTAPARRKTCRPS